MIPTDARRLQITVRAADRWQGRPLYRAIVERARALHLAGAAVFPVEIGLGPGRHIHDSRSEYEAHAVPVVVEIVDGPDRIAALLAEFRPALPGGLVTVESVRVIRHRDHEGPR